MSGVRKSERKNPQRDLPPKPSPSYDEVKKKFGIENMTIEGLIVIRYYLALRGAENGVTVMVTPFFCVQG